VNKRIVLTVLSLAIIGTMLMPVIVKAQEKQFSGFGVYIDRGDKKNHYVGSGWMGDYGDIKFSESEKENPHSGKTCIKIIYTAEGKQGANWAGIYWQWPPNNWGEKKGGFDLTGAKKLTFWARGAKGKEQIVEFKMGGLTGTFFRFGFSQHRAGGTDHRMAAVQHRFNRFGPVLYQRRFLLGDQFHGQPGRVYVLFG
jgi:hypothetical protein